MGEIMIYELLLTIGKYGNTQPRGCNRSEDFEISSANGDGMSFCRRVFITQHFTYFEMMLAKTPPAIPQAP